MSEDAIWIGDCILDSTEGMRRYLRAAAMADGIATWEGRIRPAVAQQGWTWSGAIEILPARMWRSAYPEDAEGAGLIRAVDQGRGAAFGALRETPVVKMQRKGKAVLRIEETPLPEALDAQFGIWPKRNLPEGMAKLLFAQPADATPEAPLRTWALIDAAKVPLLPSLLDASELPHACLVSGDPGLAPVVPWLVELTEDAEILRNLFSDHPADTAWWGRQPAIFLRSYAGLDPLRAHLARLVKVRSDLGRPLFFRFWEPEIAHDYLAGIADWPERVASLLYSPHARIEEVITPSLRAGTLRRFILGAEGEDALQPAPAPMLTQKDRDLLAEAHAPRFEAELAAWLPRADKTRFRPFPVEYRAEIARHAIREAQAFGFTYKEEISYFLYMMFFLGGWFHRSPHLEHFAHSFAEPGEARYGRMRHSFPADYRRAFGAAGEPMAHLDRLRRRVAERLRARGGWTRVEAQDAMDIAAEAERMLSAPPEQIARSRELAMAEARTLGLTTPRETAVFYCFWLILGAWFNRDPLYPWAGEKLASAASPAEGLWVMADYALRRIDRTLTMDQRGKAHA